MGDDCAMDSQAPPSFYFGVMSPYSWFAAERIERVLPQARWRGVLAGVVFKQHGRTSWGLTERRAEGIADCELRAARARARVDRLARAVADQRPAGRTRDGLLRAPRPRGRAGGLNRRSAGPGESLLKTFALAAMRLAFLRGRRPRTARRRDRGRAAAAAIDEHELREALGAQSVKDELRAITDEAVAAGVFGVPTVRVGDELFWGDDRLQDAAAAHGSQRRS